MVLSQTVLFPVFLQAIVSEKLIGNFRSRASIQRAEIWRAGPLVPSWEGPEFSCPRYLRNFVCILQKCCRFHEGLFGATRSVHPDPEPLRGELRV